MRLILDLVSRLRAWLSALVARPSPLGFDEQTGSWSDPDVILSASETVAPPPQPLELADCRRSRVIYAVATRNVERWDFPARGEVLLEAQHKALDYFREQLRCAHPDCGQAHGRVLWLGVSCHAEPVPSVSGAVLLRVCCRPQA